MIIAWLAVLGVVFGSFVNALVWRLHEQAALKSKKGKAVAKRRQELSITKGHSMCPNCGHTLAAKDLVPVLSWLWLRGKCRYCGVKIPDSPLTELATGLLFVVSYVSWPQTLAGAELAKFVFWLAIVVGFVALMAYDLRWFLLPDRLVFLLTGLVVVQILTVAIWRQNVEELWMPILGAVVIFGLFWGLFQISRGAWIGGGDVKLAVALGLLAGTPFRALTVIFFASLIGTLVSVPQLLKGRNGLTQRIPFGPPLILATIVVVLYGAPIADWYQHLIVPR